MNQHNHRPSEWNWQARSACRGMDVDVFFPTPDGDPEPAKAVCSACPVRVACLGFAVSRTERYGIWGGLTEKERAKLTPAEREVVTAAARRSLREQPAA